MKTRLLKWFLAAGLFALVAAPTMAGNVSWSVSVFEGPLRAHGEWIERPGYGRCWHPAYVAATWQPYCEGYWMWTDYGWYWVSDEPWGWATYHYGRWVYDSYYGWVWAPDTEWAPSWVCWREGGGYVGWAPLPPGGNFGPDGYIIVHERPVPDRLFVFVEFNNFSRPVHRRDVIVNNTTIINKTVNITKIKRVNNVVVNNGPQVNEVEKVSQRKMNTAPKHMKEETPAAVAPPGQAAPQAPGGRDKALTPKQQEKQQEAIEDKTKKEEKRDEKQEKREQKQEEKLEQKSQWRQPEIIRGSPDNPERVRTLTPEPEKKQLQKEHIEQPPVMPPPQPGQPLPQAPGQPGLNQHQQQRDGHPQVPPEEKGKEKKKDKDRDEDGVEERQK